MFQSLRTKRPTATGVFAFLAFVIALSNNPVGATGQIDGSKIKAGTITSLQIKDGGVAAADIGSKAVTNSKIANNAVSAPKLGAAAVTPAKIAVQPYLLATHTGGSEEDIPTVNFPMRWNDVTRDTSGMDLNADGHHDTFTATVAGLYHLIAVVTWTADASPLGGYEILVLHSTPHGGTNGGAYFGQSPDTGGVGGTTGVSTDMTVNVGDTITVEMIRTIPTCPDPNPPHEPLLVCGQTFGSGQQASYLVINWIGNQ